ncbi:MAG: polysaccharide deacetylase family protein [Candidatus Saccharibacteria bacterium]
MFSTSKKSWPYTLFIIAVFVSVVAIPILCSGIFEPNNQARHPLGPPVYYRDRAVVLINHDISDRECGTSISPKHFQQHLDMLKREGFNIVSLNEIARFLNKQSKLPPNAVAITFDDGYQSNYMYAYPILKARHLPATVFMIAGSEGKPADKGRMFMTWAQLSEISKNNFTVYSHTYKGHKMISGAYPTGKAWITNPLPGESYARYLRRITRDLTKAKLVLDQQIGQDTEHIAWPFGSYNQSAIDAAYMSGYKYMWTTRHFPVTETSSPSALGRVSVGRKGITVGKLKSIILQVANNKPGPQEPMDKMIKP